MRWHAKNLFSFHRKITFMSNDDVLQMRDAGVIWFNNVLNNQNIQKISIARCKTEYFMKT